ncbi:hypothetical protein [Sinorhizobium meliloti]|uniref:hypothetical protein n=1 Tax=Rhizobium meliloti TaxID=382 RepID=UPI0003FB7ED2|nr:hypothetical protein [Sinorhizobium meliloti]MDX0789660.1 hypothetical protein [Sinorhizobium medicae]MCM5689167.1 hypothetical protein [Sinorhizobium meliloti]MCO6425419.1 hypothetical protein [Sinorhizobium meliloti]MDX0158932.1 hypothetical protein [Sinorhizobium meliloti]MDX1150174.1 hypothetical protein [Sinorhizobium medicae]
MDTKTDQVSLPAFRVHFHDGKTFDIVAANSLIAEKRARARHPGGYVKKVKLIREKQHA